MRLLASTSLLLLSALALAQSGVPGGGGALPRLAEFHFDQRDYKGNLTTTDSSIAPNSHPAIEWNRVPGFETDVTHIAYVKGSAATLDIRLTNQRPHPVSGSFNFTSARLKVPGPSTVDPGPYCLPLSITCPNNSFLLQSNTSIVVTATINGLPNHVAVGGLQVKYDLPLIDNPGPNQPGPCDNGTTGNWVDWERICVLDDEPIGLQSLPWTDFLEYTCRWAYGASGPAEVRREMTKGIFSATRCPLGNRINYNPVDSNFWFVWSDGSLSTNYYLKPLIELLGDPNFSCPWIPVEGDCRDFAGLLHLALKSQGAETLCCILKATGWSGYYYWPLCPAGQDPTIDFPVFHAQRSGNYYADGFRYHVVVDYISLRYDASCAYRFDGNGSSWLQPVYEWSTATHWQRAVYPFFGHAFDTNAPFSFYDIPYGANSRTVPLTSVNNVVPSVLR